VGWSAREDDEIATVVANGMRECWTVKETRSMKSSRAAVYEPKCQVKSRFLMGWGSARPKHQQVERLTLGQPYETYAFQNSFWIAHEDVEGLDFDRTMSSC
jgi:hypothetical protein